MSQQRCQPFLAGDERCCGRCLYFQAFPRYVGNAVRGFCRRPEVWSQEGDALPLPLFVPDDEKCRCRLFIDATKYFARLGL